MAELKIHVETDGDEQLQNLERQTKALQDSAIQLSGTLRAINKAAGGQELYFATTKAREGFTSLLNEAIKLEKVMADPKIEGSSKYRELSDRLEDVREQLSGMASTASMASRVMSSNFVREVSEAAHSVQTLEQQMVATQHNIEKIQSKMGDRSAELRTKGKETKGDSVYQGLVLDLSSQKDSLRYLKEQGEEAAAHLTNLKNAQSAFGTATVKTSEDTNAFVQSLNQIPVVGQATTGVFSQMRYAMGSVQYALLGGLGFQQLGMRIFNTRSMMQKLEISFETMLQSASKASTLMDQLTQTAAKTPFGMMDVTNGAKQLLAYGTAAEEVNGILVKLGDISAGLGVGLGDLVYLYGTTMAQGRMFTQDLRQFMGRGIPMAEELGKILVAQGKATSGSMAEVQNAVTKGKVNADMVKQAIENMTAAGSRFGGLMERQSATLEGQWSNIEDTVDMMFNDMGKSTEGVFNKALTIVSDILDNWQSIVRVIGTAITAVGTYKAGLAIAAMAQKAQEKVAEKNLVNPIDERIKELKTRETAANKSVGYNIAERKTSEAQGALAKVVADSSISDEEVEKSIANAQTLGIINDKLAEELRLKREILMTQERLTAQAEQEAEVGVEKPDVLDEAVRNRDNTKESLSNTDAELQRLEAEKAELEKILNDPEKVRELAQIDFKNAQTEYADAKANKDIAEAEYNKYNGWKGDIELNKQQAVVSQMGAALGEEAGNNPQYQAELAKLEELKQKREETKVAFQQACDAEAASLKKVEEAQKALYETSAMSPKVEEAQTKIDDIDSKITEQKRVVAEKEKVTTYENEYLAEKQKLEELQQQRQVALEEFLDACNQEEEALQGVIDKQSELNNATSGSSTDGVGGGQASFAVPSDTTAPLAEAMNAATEARERLTEAQEDGGAADEAVATVQDILASGAETASEAEEANTMAKEANTAATEVGTVATETNSSAEGLNAQKKRLSQVQSQQKTLQQQKETLTTKLGAQQTQVDSIMQTKDAMAKRQNGLAGMFLAAKNGVLSASNTALAFGQRILTAAIMEAKNAWNAFTASLLANPITAIITAVTTLGSIFYMFASDSDEATKSTEDYNNAAEEAAEKATTLYAVLESATKGSKAYKDAYAELVSIAEEYGLKIEDEKNKTAELISKKEQLIGLIKEQSIEEQRAADVKAAADEYKSQIENIKNKIKGDLDIDDGVANQMLNLITQEDIKRLADAQKAFVEYSHQGDMSAEAYNEAINKLNGAMQQSLAKVRAFGEAMGWSDDEINRVTSSIRKQVVPIMNATDAYNSSMEAIDASSEAARKAAIATDGMTAAQRAAAAKARILQAEGNELGDVLGNLLQQYGDMTFRMNFEAKMTNVNVPDWMLKKTSEELRTAAAKWTAEYTELASTALQTKLVDGKAYTKDQIAELAMQYGAAYEQVKTKEDKDKEEAAANKDKKDKEAAKNKKDADRRRDATAKANKAYTDALTASASKMYETIRKDETDAMEEGTGKTIQKINDSTRSQLKALEQQKKKLIDARKKQATAVWVNAAKDRKESDWANTDEGKRTDEEWWNEINTTTAKDEKGEEIKNAAGDVMTIADLIAEQENAINAKRERSLEEVNKKLLAEYKDYAEKYGTETQRLAALDQNYAMKRKEIMESTDTDEQKQQKLYALEKDYKAGKSSITNESIASDIDWVTVLGGVGKMNKDMMQVMYDKLSAYTETEDFKKASTTDQQKVVDIMNEMRNYLGTGGTTWQELGVAINEFKTAISEYRAAVANEQELYARLAQAKADLDSGKITKVQYDQIVKDALDASRATTTAKGKLDEKGGEVNAKNTEIKDQVSPLTTTLQSGEATWGGTEGFGGMLDASKNWDGLKGALEATLPELEGTLAGTIGDGVASAMGGMSSFMNGGLSSIISSGVGQMVGVIAQIPQMLLQFVDSIKQWVTGILDSFTELLSFSWLEDFVNSILEAFSKLIDTVLDLPENIYHVIESIVVNGIGGLLNTIVGRVANIISFGALDSNVGSWFQSGNAERIREEIEDLNDRNEILVEAIDKLTSELQKQSGTKAIATAEKLLQYQKEQMENTKRIYQAQMAYSGAHHSFNANWSGFTSEELSRMNRLFGRKEGNEWTGDWGDLTPEEAKLLLADADIVERIQNTGSSVYANQVLDDLKAYAELAGDIQDTIDTLNEQLTGTSFDSLKDNFISSLMDMESSAEDFANNFTEMLMQAVLQARISDELDDQIESFYKKWAEYSSGKRTESDGTQTVTNDEGLSESEIAELKNDWSNITEQGLAIRDEIANLTGYDKSYNQKASSGAYQTMSQEVGEELNGRFTAVQEATEGTWYQAQLINEKLTQLMSLNNIPTSDAQYSDIAERTNMANSETTLQTIASEVAYLRAYSESSNIICDEGRTILAQMQLSLASIDNRQQDWEKPFKLMFAQIKDIRDDIHTKL